MPSPPTTLRVTRAQLRALATVGRWIAPDLHRVFDDQRSTRAAERAFETIDDHLRDIRRDPIDLDLEALADLHAELRSAEMAGLLRARIRDLLAVLILWRAIERLGPAADTAHLLDVPAIDELGWRAEVLDLLIDHGVQVTLPGEGRRGG